MKFREKNPKKVKATKREGEDYRRTKMGRTSICQKKKKKDGED